MKCVPSMVLAAITFGFIAALMTVSGCSEAASRNLTLFQFQSSETSAGPFHIDVSQLPPDAIETRTETGGPGRPVTRLTLNMDYEFEIVLRLVDQKETNVRRAGETAASDASH